MMALLLVLLAAMPATSTPAAAGDVVDRIVAVVDDDPIFLSDVERVVALALIAPEEGESPRQLRRRVLDALIEERLRLHEVERYEVAGRVSVDDVERQLANVRQQFGDEAELEAALADLGLDQEGLRHLLTRQLRVVVYIEERLAPRVFVDLDDIRAYYDTELTAAMARRNAALPPLAEVREAIRTLLRERRLNEEIEAWTEELRLAADILDHFDRPAAELPPVVRRIEKDGG